VISPRSRAIDRRLELARTTRLDPPPTSTSTGEVSISRTTTRRLELGPDLVGGLRLRVPVQEKWIRPVVLTETVTQDERGQTYCVRISGPVQTLAGDDHQSRSATVRYGYAGAAIDTLPVALAGSVLGADALRTWQE